MKRHILIIAGFLILATPITPIAMAAPLPEKKDEALNAVNNRLEQEKQRKKALARKAQSLEGQLEDTRAELTAVTRAVRNNQSALENLDKKITALSAEQENRTAALEKNYGSIANLILALERIKRIPPEALIVRPGAPLETAQTALLLQGVLPAVYEKADRLSTELQRLENIEKTLKEDKTEQLALQKELAAKQQQMSALINERERLFSSTQKDLKQSGQQLTALARKAKDLEDLLARVKEENRTQRHNSLKTASAATVPDVPIPAMGDGILPVNGRILTGFGQRDQIGAESEGLRIESQPSSIVTSPLGGVVRFEGEFKNYGNMVIIEHKNGYHSLIAGFGQTNVSMGQAVNAGEPVGKLPYTSSRGGRPTLYYELRYKGRAIDPSRKLSKLKS